MREIVYRWDGAIASVHSTEAPLIAPLLQYTTITARAAGGSTCIAKSTHTLGRKEGSRFLIPAKLTFEIGSSLAHRNIRFVPARKFNAPQPDRAAIPLMPPSPIRQLIETQRVIVGGLIRTDRPEDMIPDLLRIYPHCRIILAVKNRREISAWLSRLQSVPIPPLPQRVCTVRDLHSHFWGSNPKVLVTSFEHLDHCRKEDFNLVIVPDATRLADSDRWEPDYVAPRGKDYRLLRHPEIPVFGFLSPGHQLSPGERLRLLSMFVQELRTPGVERAGVSVRVVRCSRRPLASTLSPDDDIRAFKRDAIWRNSQRNIRVAAIANEYATSGAANRVCVLAENPDHARHLGEHLPGWCLRPQSIEGSLPVDQTPRGMIVTDHWAGSQPALDIDVLIDARRWGAVDIPSFPPLAAAPDHEVLLVDIADCATEMGRTKSIARCKEYQRRGWQRV